MTRKPEKLSDDLRGHEERLRRAQERSVKVLGCKAAQDADAPTMGMTMNFVIDQSTGLAREIRMAAPDAEELAVAAMLARPFTLAREAIYGPDVSRSLVAFADTDEQRVMCEQVGRMWSSLPRDRMTLFAAKLDGTPILPEAGVGDGVVADRVLYSQLVHADDASDLLGHIDSAQQQWSLAGLVGDWLAVIAHQQALLHWVRPDICERVTAWPGTPQTVFDRWGVTPVEKSPAGAEPKT